jgi:hypothetical protein
MSKPDSSTLIGDVLIDRRHVQSLLLAPTLTLQANQRCWTRLFFHSSKATSSGPTTQQKHDKHEQALPGNRNPELSGGCATWIDFRSPDRSGASSSALGLTNSGMLVADTIIVLHPPQSSGKSTSDGLLSPCNREDQQPCSINAAKMSKSACSRDTDRNLPPDELPIQAFTPRLVSSHARSSLCSQPKIVRHLQVPSGSERFRFEYDPLLSPSPKRSVSS